MELELFKPCPNGDTPNHRCGLCVDGFVLTDDGLLLSKLLQKQFGISLRNRLSASTRRPEVLDTGYKEAVLEAHGILDKWGVPAANGERPPGVSQLGQRLKLLLDEFENAGFSMLSKEPTS